ncbi:hypothetical protein [Streptomyces sp. LUP30]|uniref:hypothetical protein n=1 Tax=Streptomyces sp. LUP30 TaxID=1890285 RepID=UPI00114CF696|nr:hypothetical protein [Streptomyces sp. LUP30]
MRTTRRTLGTGPMSTGTSEEERPLRLLPVKRAEIDDDQEHGEVVPAEQRGPRRRKLGGRGQQ